MAAVEAVSLADGERLWRAAYAFGGDAEIARPGEQVEGLDGQNKILDILQRAT